MQNAEFGSNWLLINRVSSKTSFLSHILVRWRGAAVDSSVIFSATRWREEMNWKGQQGGWTGWKEGEWVKRRNVEKSSMKLCPGLSTAENVPRFRTHHLQSKQRRMERQLKIRWTRENPSFTSNCSGARIKVATWQQVQWESGSRKQVLEPSEKRAEYDKSVSDQSCRMSRIPRIYPCKKVAKCGKLGNFNVGKSLFKCFVRLNYLTFCNSASDKSSNLTSTVREWKLSYLLRGDRVRFWLHACFTLPTPIYQTASKFSYMHFRNLHWQCNGIVDIANIVDIVDVVDQCVTVPMLNDTDNFFRYQIFSMPGPISPEKINNSRYRYPS